MQEELIKSLFPFLIYKGDKNINKFIKIIMNYTNYYFIFNIKLFDGEILYKPYKHIFIYLFILPKASKQ